VELLAKVSESTVETNNPQNSEVVVLQKRTFDNIMFPFLACVISDDLEVISVLGMCKNTALYILHRSLKLNRNPSWKSMLILGTCVHTLCFAEETMY